MNEGLYRLAWLRIPGCASGALKALVSHFGSAEEASELLSAAGLMSIPEWVKPYNVLSTGQKFSADLARSILGYRTQVNLKQGLEELVVWITEQPRRNFTYHLPLEIQNDKTPKTWSKKLI